MTIGVGSGDEQHCATLDESAIFIGKGPMQGDLRQTIRDRARLAHIL
jgi:hypothetical protein